MVLPLQYLSVGQWSISLNPIKLLMELKILEKCPSCNSLSDPKINKRLSCLESPVTHYVPHPTNYLHSL